jgi:hypothetical protein
MLPDTSFYEALPSELLIIVWQLNIVLLEDYRLIVERR